MPNKPSPEKKKARPIKHKKKAIFSLADLAVSTIKVLAKTPERSKPYEKGVIQMKKRQEWKGVKSIAYTAKVKTLFLHKRTKETLKRFPTVYNMSIRFYNIDPDTETPSLSKTPTRLRCTCPAYVFYWAFANWLLEALEGKPSKWSKTPAKQKNPGSVPGMCKHLLAFSKELVKKKEIEP